jgi:hypothetical protein
LLGKVRWETAHDRPSRKRPYAYRGGIGIIRSRPKRASASRPSGEWNETKRRNSNGHHLSDADKFRLKHAEELLALFEGARGRPARTTDELAQWLDSVDDDLADDIAREVAEEAGRKAGREAAKNNGREAYEESSYRAYERAYERVLESLKKARRLDRP